MDQFALAGKRWFVGQSNRSRLVGWLTNCLLVGVVAIMTGCSSAPHSPSQRAVVPSANQISGNWVQVQRGDTLGKLATRANVPLERLQRFNPGVDARKLKVGQRLLIPSQQERAPSGALIATKFALAIHFQASRAISVQRAAAFRAPTPVPHPPI